MTAHSRHLYEQLAELLEYPDPETIARAEDVRAELADRCPQAAQAVEAFGNWAASTDLLEQEELFARTFDFHPPHCLDLGYQLFGENYKRGLFLVKVKEALDAQKVGHGTELPDHLTVVLRLLPRLSGPQAHSLVDEVILPAVSRVLGAFTEPTNPYRLLLEATVALLQQDFGIQTIRPVPEDHGKVMPPGMTNTPSGVLLPANRHDESGGNAP